jgi:DNA primase
MARLMPERFSAVLGPKSRVKKIFIDYLRNSKGASTVAVFSARARSGMGVSMPIAWEELKDIGRADQWTIKTAPSRIHSLKADPWKGFTARGKASRWRCEGRSACADRSSIRLAVACRDYEHGGTIKN